MMDTLICPRCQGTMPKHWIQGEDQGEYQLYRCADCGQYAGRLIENGEA